MFRASVVLIVSCFSFAYCGWVEDLAEMNLGGKFGLHLDEIEDRNLSLIERHKLRMDLAGIGISVSKIPGENKVVVDVYNGIGEEGRGKKMGQMIVPILIGFKVMAVVAIMFAAIGGLVLQALAAAKLSLALSAILAVGKLFGKQSYAKHHRQPYIKYQQLPPLHTVSYDLPVHAGIQEFGGFPGVGFDGFASNYHSPEIQEISSGVDVSAISSNKHPVISLSEQPIAVHRRQYSKPEFDATTYKKRRI